MDFYNDRRIRFDKVDIKQRLNRLPVGIQIENDGDITLDRDVSFRELSRDDVKKIRDEKFATSKPQQWFARVVALVCESLAGEPVYSEYEKSGFKKLPDIVLNLSIQDAYYVLVVGHIFNFDYELPDVKAKCPHCGREREYPMSLENIQVEEDNRDFHEFDIQLPRGIKVKDRATEEDVVYTNMKMVLPTLQDAINNETSFRLNGQGVFMEKIYADCTTELSTADGTILDAQTIKMRSHTLFDKLSARDSLEIETVINSVPSLLTYITQECYNCSEELPIVVQSSFLYPTRR